MFRTETRASQPIFLDVDDLLQNSTLQKQALLDLYQLQPSSFGTSLSAAVTLFLSTDLLESASSQSCLAHRSVRLPGLHQRRMVKPTNNPS